MIHVAAVFDSILISRYGRSEFEQLCRYIARSLSSKNIEELDIHEELSPVLHDNIKKAFASIVWGELFSTVGASVLVIQEGTHSGESLNELQGDAYITKFSVSKCTSKFLLHDNFSVKLNTCDNNFIVKLDEAKLWELIYTDSRVIEKIGRDSCYILDFAYNLGGSEAIAETYFGIMQHQFKDNSLVETADMRSLISYCLPDVAKCPKTVSAIAKIFREGDLQNKVAPHRSPIFYDRRGRTANKYLVSKAIDAFRGKEGGLQFFN